MKTAMQELIDYANELDFGGWEDVFIQKATELLEKEKHHIQMAFNDGRVTGAFKRIKNSDDYFNETYNQNK